MQPDPDMTYRAFFGDGERAFRITAELIPELERKTNAGVGSLFNRLVAREFALADVSETIRLGLIGGGETPKRAAELMQLYALNRPFNESYPVALGILETLWFGATKETPKDQQ